MRLREMSMMMMARTTMRQISVLGEHSINPVPRYMIFRLVYSTDTDLNSEGDPGVPVPNNYKVLRESFNFFKETRSNFSHSIWSTSSGIISWWICYNNVGLVILHYYLHMRVTLILFFANNTKTATNWPECGRVVTNVGFQGYKDLMKCKNETTDHSETPHCPNLHIIIISMRFLGIVLLGHFK